MRPSFVALAPLALAACTDASTVRVGSPAPPRPETCELELIDHDASRGMPADLDLLGYVRVTHEDGKSPSDPDVLKVLKPEACKLGGEKVSAGLSANASNGLRSNSVHTYMVWRAKQAAAPKKPVKF